jgi:uncharacterized membrane protein
MRKPTPTQYLFKRKTVIKTITWRVISILLGFSMSLIFGFSSKDATVFTLVFNFTAMICYYMHELVYRLIKYKRKYGKKNASKVLQK